MTNMKVTNLLDNSLHIHTDFLLSICNETECKFVQLFFVKIYKIKLKCVGYKKVLCVQNICPKIGIVNLIFVILRQVPVNYVYIIL